MRSLTKSIISIFVICAFLSGSVLTHNNFTDLNTDINTDANINLNLDLNLEDLDIQDNSLINQQTPTEQYIQCLKNKELTIYGTSWCPHCKTQKEKFGEYLKEVNYVDCGKSKRLCRKKRIYSYPTILLSNGQNIRPGSIQEIAEGAGCRLQQFDTEFNLDNTSDEKDYHIDSSPYNDGTIMIENIKL